jgi:hypothetical protein
MSDESTGESTSTGDITTDTEVSYNATDVTPGKFCALMPGDRVLALVPDPDKEDPRTGKLVGGTVQRICIPGPMSEDKVVEVEIDEDLPFLNKSVRRGWWSPEHLEPLHG